MSKNNTSRLISKLLIGILVLLSIQTSIIAVDSIKIIVNGEQLFLSSPALIENGTTLVPLRDVFEGLGVEPIWDESTRSVTAEKDGTTIWLQLNNKIAKVNNKKIALSAPPKLVKGTMLIPLRFVSEAFGTVPNWDGQTNTITINTINEWGPINKIRINKYNIDEIFSLTYGEVVKKYGSNYYQGKIYGGVYLRYSELGITFFFDTADENDFSGKTAAIGLFGNSTFEGVRTGMYTEQVKKILGTPRAEGFEEDCDSGTIQWVLSYRINNRSIEITSNTSQEPINAIMIWNK